MSEHKLKEPTSLDAEIEQQILGAILVYPEKIDSVLSVIDSTDFCDPLHQRMFDAISKIHEDGTHISPITLNLRMRDDPGLKEVGGIKYLAALAGASPSLPSVMSLAKEVKLSHGRRSLCLIGESLIEASKTQDSPIQEQIQEAEQSLYALAEKSQYGSRQLGFGAAVKLAIEQAEKAQTKGDKLTGLSTGLTELDQLLGGLQKSDLIILAGRPAMGKSALAGNIAFHAASHAHPGLFFSLEMSSPQISMRILSDQTGIEMWRIRNGQMRPEEWDDYILTGRKLDDLPLFIDDTGGISLPQLCARARRAKREHKIEWIVVDYLQLMAGGRKDGNRVQEVTEITKGLKALAKELDIPILALSQLSRGVDARDDKRPVLSDLRESGSIEQDADVVMFVFRAEYYLQTKEPDITDPLYGKWQEKMEKAHGKADLLVEKHRHGATKAIHLAFEGKLTRFSDPEI